MKKITLCLAALLICLRAVSVEYFDGTYAEALVKARQENKPVLLFFTASWCGPCRGMKAFVLSDPEVSNYIDANYIPLQLDFDLPENKELYARYSDDKGGIPKFLIINDKEEVLKVLNGSVLLKVFKKFIQLEGNPVPIGKISDQPGIVKQENQNKKIDKLFFKLMHTRVKPGVRAGMDFTNFHSSPSSLYDDYRTGYHFGLSAQTRIRRHWYLESGLSFVSLGAKNKDAETTYRLNYLELPVMIGVDLLYIFSGNYLHLDLIPYGAMGVGGKYKNAGGKERVSFGNREEDIRRWDYGVKTALNLQLGTFELSMGYRWGLHNLSNLSGTKLYNRGLYFTTGMNFGR